MGRRRQAVAKPRRASSVAAALASRMWRGYTWPANESTRATRPACCRRGQGTSRPCQDRQQRQRHGQRAQVDPDPGAHLGRLPRHRLQEAAAHQRREVVGHQLVHAALLVALHQQRERRGGGEGQARAGDSGQEPAVTALRHQLG
jgi:hypothetical protein